MEGSAKTHPYAAPARKGYPYLISQGQALQQSEVAFRDLTMMFKDKEEAVYRDACCHLTARGYDYVIDEIVETIKAGGSTAAGEQAGQ
jgi:hypothetical protein